MKVEDQRKADAGDEESGKNSKRSLHVAKIAETTRLRTTAGWSRKAGVWIPCANVAT